jgi:hypothetical protein
MVLLYAGLLLVVAVVWSALLVRAGEGGDRRRAADATQALERTGLVVSGDPLGSYALVGRAHDVDITLENGDAKPRPGVTQESEPVCLVKVAADLADQLVCVASEVDAVMGPLPSVPRIKTGFAPFDQRYAVFGGPAPWAQPALLQRFLDLGLRWLRVREGRCEIAFPPLATDDLPRAIALGATVARLPSGAVPVEAARGPRLALDPLRARSSPAGAVGLTWLAAVVIVPWPSFILATIPGLLDLDAPLECEGGAALREVGCGSDSSCLECASGPDHFHGLHYLGCSLLGVTAFALLALGYVTVRQLRR